MKTARELTGALRILKQAAYPIVAIVLALTGGGVIIASLGFNPFSAYANLFEGALGGSYQLSETVIKACPVIFTGLSYAVAKRCGLINLGAEGQLYMGALFATLVGTNLGFLPVFVHLPLSLAAGFLGGALYGLLAALLKVKFGANELITTIMLNSIATAFVSYCVSGPMMDVSGNLPQSRLIFDTAILPRLMNGSRLHLGVLIALAGLFFYYFLMWRTAKGFEMRVVGLNAHAGAYAGVNIKRSILLAMLMAGGFAGLGGSLEILGVQYRLMQGFSSNYGFDGIAVALLGNNTPLGIALSGLLFGALRSGSSKMEMMSKVPSAVIFMIQAFVILFVIGRNIFSLQKRRAKSEVRK